MEPTTKGHDMTTDISTIEAHYVTLTKPAQRALQTQAIKDAQASIVSSVNTRQLAIRGWQVELAPEHTGEVSWEQRNSYDDTSRYVYEYKLLVTFTPAANRKPSEPQELAAIVRTIATRHAQPQYGRWTLAAVDGEPYQRSNQSDEDGTVSDDAIGYAVVDIPADWDDNFTHLYGLDAHVGMVLRALEAGVSSDWADREHVALIGPPGCGKSDICQSVKRALGDDAVMELDATATTDAGAIKDLAEREILPRVMVIEEIEKAPEKAMTFLLALMDTRAEIRKTTARGKIERDTKVFVIATVNDRDLFDKLQSGALSSRFSNRVFFSRPSREVLRRILAREVKRVKGDTKWINPTLDYCEQHDITDPRRAKSILLCGREMLLTGEYQDMLAATSSAVAESVS